MPTNPGRPSPGPDIVFAKVQEVLARGGCPICHIGTDSARRFLWGFLYERVNDPGSREEVLASRGFCARHAWALGQFHDTLGIAIVYRHLLQDLRKDVGGVGRGPKARRVRRAGRSTTRTRTPLAPAGECPACRTVRHTEDSALHAVVMRLDLREVRERLNGPSALCLPHFLAGLSLADDAGTRRLIDFQLTALTAVIHDLDELIRKHDYRFSAERLTEDEAQAWSRAIELLAGRDPLELRRPWSPPH